MKTPVDVSYLADSVLLLRYFESHGAVRRALSVVKKRTARTKARFAKWIFRRRHSRRQNFK
jgi:hypothetical protein